MSPAPQTFGEIPGYPPGSRFANRAELSEARVHRPLMAGISGSAGGGGAESIVVSGGYEDDLDEGDWIVYTGQGGNDPNTMRQVADQDLVRGNLALTVNASEGVPVRVVRGSRHKSQHSPSEGFRYDGLYYVDRYWHEIGRSGFLIYRFMLRKAEAPAPIYAINEKMDLRVADRRVVEIQRIVRNTATATMVKHLNGYRCQVCVSRLVTPAGPYAEGAHIKPLGRPHEGPDIAPNILCLCPNHHLLFDRGAFSVAEDFRLIGIEGALTVSPKHHVGSEFLVYHREHYLDPRSRGH